MSEILPHESTLLAEAIETAKADLAFKSRQQGEEAGPGSDWHDNPAYDEAVKQTAMARGTLGALREKLDHSKIVDYPQIDSQQIALGSLVYAKDRIGHMPFVIVGQRITGASRYSEAWSNDHPDHEELTVVTPNSAMGRAALGTTVGTTLEYTTDAGRKVTINIDEIDQSWVKNIFQGDSGTTE
jgi:transcription elongation GreA/GreB family factor